MLKVGLTGGLACGKTFVGEALAGYGCLLIQADELGHEVLEPGGEAYDEVVGEFGPGILSADGHIDRRRAGGPGIRLAGPVGSAQQPGSSAGGPPRGGIDTPRSLPGIRMASPWWKRPF